MRIKILMLFFGFCILFNSCVAPYWLPEPNKILENPYGASIILFLKANRVITGEFIALDSTNVFVMINKKNKPEIKSVPIERINRFKIQCARFKSYGWSIPVFTALCFTHGFFAVLTIPLNLLVTSSVTEASSRAYRYKGRSQNLENLKKFSRFPQGLPPEIALSAIH